MTSRVQTSWKFEVFSKNVDCSWVRVFTLRSTPGEFETRLCYCFCRVECCAVVWSSGFLESLGGFVVWFWLANLGSKGFEVQPLGFKAVQSSLFLDMTQH